MKHFFVLPALVCIITATSRAQGNIDTSLTKTPYEWADSMSYEQRVALVEYIIDQHDALLNNENYNFDELRPFFINKIKEYDTYYAIEVIDSTKAFHYTVISPKTKKTRHKNRNDIAEGLVYYFNLRKLTNYSGKIGCSEVLHDVSFEVNGKKVRYVSSDVLDAPPVCTENLNGLRYVKKIAK